MQGGWSHTIPISWSRASRIKMCRTDSFLTWTDAIPSRAVHGGKANLDAGQAIEAGRHDDRFDRPGIQWLQSHAVSVRPPERELSQLAAVAFAKTGS